MTDKPAGQTLQIQRVTLEGEDWSTAFNAVWLATEDAAVRRRLTALRRNGKIKSFHIQIIGSSTVHDEAFRTRLAELEGKPIKARKSAADRIEGAVDGLTEAVQELSDVVRDRNPKS